ncbi:HD domain-containing protein [Phytoactinopolyspora mesophila]|uniref:Metal-dependent phosphohydrolase n=1 Tax=Phytoactinopolyspora mesophila TaxID=2650750 RepID=A0A7K3M4F0_9ACTN|nr:metal-dependent phosphohydrolase [Phytoactinopolyspora mesophila]NDL58193.1 metal-dependent phosphohydrolase [Phytoactinopolyspora mesophila]
MRDLQERWTALVGSSASSVRRGNDLLARWSEPHRHYHSLAHLRAVLDALDLLAAEMKSPVSVRLAAWFHDAVYDGRPGEDERASAALAAEALAELGYPGGQVEDVARLVLLTVHHDPEPGDVDGATLCDADLSVLGSTQAAYQQYAEAVRRDYSHVSDAAFRNGRLIVVETLLNRQRLFRTPTGQALWDDAARRNLAVELTHLRTSP